MSLRAQVMERIAQAEALFQSETPVTPWEAATAQHAEKLATLTASWELAKANLNETGKARRVALTELRHHEDTLATIALADVPEWAATARRLAGLVEALTERQRLQGITEDHLRKQLQRLQAEDPAAIVKAGEVARLRSILASDAPDKIKRQAFAELEKIDAIDRPKVVNLSPHVDESKYTPGGMLK